MLSLLRRKWLPPVTETSVSQSPELPNDLPAGLFQPESAASLLATPRRQKLLEHIWQRTALSHQQFAWLYRAPLERYAELVQQFPASESHHHAYPGGMLDHGLEIVAYALKLRQSHLLPAGASPEDQSAQSEAWTAATAYAALLHDIGKLAVDMHVEYEDGGIWHPWHYPLQQPYRFRYRDDRVYRLHSAATGLLYHQLFDRNILDWLSGYPALWSALLYVLAGQYEHAGVLGELVIQADRASVAQELGGDPTKAMAAPKHSLQRKLLDGLRYLLKQELKLNQPQASDGWLTQDSLWLVSKTVSDKLRAHLLSQGVDGIPANNSAVFDVLQDHAILQPTPEDKAIWKATITSATGWSHSFTLLRLAPALIWQANQRPEAFTGTVTVETPTTETTRTTDTVPNIDPALGAAATAPSGAPIQQDPKQELANATAPDSTEKAGGQPNVIEDLLSMLDMPAPTTATSSPAVATDSANTAPNTNELALKPPASEASPKTTTAQPSGEHFMTWLKQGIQSRKLIINDAKALIHTVADTVFLVSPGVFQRYAQEHPRIAVWSKEDNQQDWQWIQKRFEKLQLHRKQPSGLNIWTCEVTGPRKSRRLHGYLLRNSRNLFDEIPLNNPYLTVSAD